MGCGRSTFKIAGRVVYFSEGNDDVGCVCTFPRNGVSREVVYSLALLGAAMRMSRDMGVAMGPEEWVSVTDLVGDDMVQKIRAAIYGGSACADS